MTICLQGGNEFSAGCREMDADLVRRAPGRVVVTALAGSPGRDYDTATANGVRHFRSLGAPDVIGAPDVRTDPAAALEILRSARLLVLPGGSPSRLLAVLTDSEVGHLLVDLLADDVLILGSSAGAMVLCPVTVLPDRRPSPLAVSGLGLAAGVAVLPHWSSRGRADWLNLLATAGPGLELLGLPEESGVLLTSSVLTAVGRMPTRLLTTGRDLAPGESCSLA